MPKKQTTINISTSQTLTQTPSTLKRHLRTLTRWSRKNIFKKVLLPILLLFLLNKCLHVFKNSKKINLGQKNKNLHPKHAELINSVKPHKGHEKGERLDLEESKMKLAMNNSGHVDKWERYLRDLGGPG